MNPFLLVAILASLAGCGVVWHPVDRDYFHDKCIQHEENNDVIIPCRIEARARH